MAQQLALTNTAANSVFQLAVNIVFPVPQLLQGYATDSAFDTAASVPAEVAIGVDGQISAGYVPFLTPQTISLAATSSSNVIFETWLAAMKANQQIYYANAYIALTSVGRAYTMTNGVLTSVIAIPGTRKVLQARAYTITWGSIDPAPVAVS